MQEGEKKIIASYDYHAAIPKVFKGCTLTLIDQHGRQTGNTKIAKEMIVANF